MKDIERRIELLDIKDELAKTLEPCPFCGGEAYIEDISEPNDMDAIWMIVCDKCGGSASFGMDGCDATKDEAIAAWNRRVEK